MNQRIVNTVDDWSVSVGRSELQAVVSALRVLNPIETDGGGIWLRNLEGNRIWTVAGREVIWEVTGDVCTTRIEPCLLPARIVWDAYVLCHREHSFEITLEVADGAVVKATATAGQSVIDLPAQGEAPFMPSYCTEAAAAVIDWETMRGLLARACAVPYGAASDATAEHVLHLGDNQVTVHTDWRVAGGFATTQRAIAVTTGTASTGIWPKFFETLFAEMELEEDITIELPTDVSLPMVVSCGCISVAVPQIPSGVLRHHDRLESVLTSIPGAKVHVARRGDFDMVIGTRNFCVRLLDAHYEGIRVTAGLCRRLEPSLEVLTQINESNAGLEGVRLSLSEGDLLAIIDLPIAAIDDFGDVFNAALNQLDGFSVFFGGLGGRA